jgi:hypothetical protein
VDTYTVQDFQAAFEALPDEGSNQLLRRSGPSDTHTLSFTCCISRACLNDFPMRHSSY